MRWSEGCRNQLCYWLLGVVLAWWTAPASIAQQAAEQGSAPPPQEIPTFRSQSEEVMLDLIVRDKRARPVQDLQASEVQVLEDGQPVRVTGLRMTRSAGSGESNGGTRAGTAGASQATSEAPLRLVTLLFEPMGTEPSRMAGRAAVDFVRTLGGAPGVYVSVVYAGSRVSVIQPFTSDVALLRKAVERAAGMGQGGRKNESRQEEAALRSMAGDPQSEQRLREGEVTMFDEQGSERSVAQMMVNMLRVAEDTTRELRGRTPIAALFALAKSLSEMPGRKAVIYFSEGLIVPSSLGDQFQSIISTANRSNLSIYTIDASGVALAARNEEARQALLAAARESMTQVTQSSDRPITAAQMKSLDLAEASTRSNQQNSLVALAERTGGTFTGDTNDLTGRMRRIVDDVRTYYELTYVPAPRRGDGSYRRIQVVIPRPGVQVQSREGYFDLPEYAVHAVEAQMLKSLDEEDLPREFALSVSAGLFAPGWIRREGWERAGGNLTAAGPSTADSAAGALGAVGMPQILITAEVPMAELSYSQDPRNNNYRAGVAFVARVKNVQGEVVYKSERLIPIQGPMKKLAERKKGYCYFSRLVSLPMGEYVVEVAASDRESGHASARRTSVKVENTPRGLDISQPLIVRRYQGSRDRYDADVLLNFDTNIVGPVPQPVYEDGEVVDLQVFFLVYPDRQGARPQLELELRNGDRVMARSRLEFSGTLRADAPDSEGGRAATGRDGEYPYLAAATLKGLEPGGYQARVVARQGSRDTSRSTFFTVSGVPPPLSQGTAPPVGPIEDEDDEAHAEAMPAIVPERVETAGAPPFEEQQRVLEEVRAYALSYVEHLPNFRCHQVTRRLAGRLRDSELKQQDVVVEQITYEDGKELYSTVEVNGVPSSLSRKDMRGVFSRGQFANLMKSIFRPETETRFRWEGWAMLNGERHHVFHIEVAKAKSNFVINQDLRQDVAGMDGRVYIDEQSSSITRIVVNGTDLPKNFPLQSPTLSLEYGLVRIGESDHVLPLESVLQVRSGKRAIRNEISFRDYLKFAAESSVSY